MNSTINRRKSTEAYDSAEGASVGLPQSAGDARGPGETVKPTGLLIYEVVAVGKDN
jgi:hypothetical protein